MDLEPATWYNLRITAHNSAGFTVAEYEFATLTVTGGIYVIIFSFVLGLFYSLPRKVDDTVFERSENKYMVHYGYILYRIIFQI